jgi:hypothetical protein
MIVPFQDSHQVRFGSDVVNLNANDYREIGRTSTFRYEPW